MARAAMGWLRPRLHPGWRAPGRYVLGLMTDDRNHFTRLERLARAHDVFNQRTPTGAMQHLRQGGFQSRALACSQDHYHVIRSCHAYIVSGSRPFDNELRCRTVRMGHLCGAMRWGPISLRQEPWRPRGFGDVPRG